MQVQIADFEFYAFAKHKINPVKKDFPDGVKTDLSPLYGGSGNAQMVAM